MAYSKRSAIDPNTWGASGNLLEAGNNLGDKIDSRVRAHATATTTVFA